MKASARQEQGKLEELAHSLCARALFGFLSQSCAGLWKAKDMKLVQTTKSRNDDGGIT